MTRTAQINLRLLAASALAASVEQTRYYLNGVCVEVRPRDTLYVSTNGHILFAARDELHPEIADNTLCGTWIVPLENCKSFKLSRRSTVEHADMSTDASGKLYLDYLGDLRGFTPIDGTFPDWRRVIPDAPREGAQDDMTYDPKYIDVFAKIHKSLGDCDDRVPHIVPNGSGPALVWFDPTDRYVGAIMPIRMRDDRARRAPEWINAKPAPAKAAPEPIADNVTPLRAAS